MKKRKPVLSESLFRVTRGFRAKDAPHCDVVTVTKVGRKYFTVSRDSVSAWESTHAIEDWSEKTEYTSRASLYESEQAYREEQEATDLYEKIRKAFSPYENPMLSLQTLRQIAAVIDILQ